MAKTKKKQLAKNIYEAKKLYKRSNEETICVEASAEIVNVVNELKRMEVLKKNLQNLEDSYKMKVKNFMQLNQQLKSDDFIIATWKNHMRKSFDASSFKSEFPDLYQSYLKDINIRVFKIY